MKSFTIIVNKESATGFRDALLAKSPKGRQEVRDSNAAWESLVEPFFREERPNESNPDQIAHLFRADAPASNAASVAESTFNYIRSALDAIFDGGKMSALQCRRVEAADNAFEAAKAAAKDAPKT